MGFQDRHYQQVPQSGGGFGRGPQGVGFAMPRPTPVVKVLLIINVVTYLLQLMLQGRVEYYFALSALSGQQAMQIWRLITFQFLHGDTMHLLFNMLGVYFLGPALERHWGSSRFLRFYLTCGVVGGIVFLIIGNLFQWFGGILIGASGGVLGMLVACAILFPQFVVILIFFPVPIRFAAILFTAIYLLSVISELFNPGSTGNAGGDICHLGGMATGALWVWGRPFYEARKAKYEQAITQKHQQMQAKQQYEVDRILAKVHEKGVHSLTPSEKRALQRATDQEKHKSSR